jgi:large subunit ribosomal protein L31
MKQNTHPKYEFVIYRCPSTGTEILTRSTKLDGPAMKVSGKDVPTVSIEICSDNHPFYTGKAGLIDTAGRVDAFNKRFATRRIAGKKA